MRSDRVRDALTNNNGGFTCTTSPTSSSNTTYIPSSGPILAISALSVNYNSYTAYNGCWVSTQVGHRRSLARGRRPACLTNLSGSAVSGCGCTGSGSSRSCTGKLYTYRLTQPGPNDLVDKQETSPCHRRRRMDQQPMDRD